MNSVKIEKGAIESLKRVIRLHERMDEFLQSNDKEPSWDGDIFLYSSNDLKVENILYKIPTQVKGKNNEELLNRKRITYPVKYKYLRNYFNDNGVCYFVIIISNDGERTTIFYNALTPIKLQDLLKKSEEKGPNQTISIVLNRLEGNNKDKLYNDLLQFGFDSKEQGARELVRKSISIEDIRKIDDIRVTTFASNDKEVMDKVVNGEACLFGHLSDGDIWLPFAYETQKKMELSAYIRQNETFGIDGIPYYDSFELRKNMDGNISFQLSENLVIEIIKNKIIFKAQTELDQIVRDIDFLEAIQQGKSLYIGKKKICDYGNTNFDEGLQNSINNLTLISSAIMEFGIELNKKLGDFKESDWKAIDELIKIYQGKIRPQKETAWHMWWWQDKVVPFFLAIDSNGKLSIENGTNFKHLTISVGSEEERYIVPSFITFKRNIWEKLYDVHKEVLLEELDKGEFNKETAADFTQLFIEILAAYDITKNENYYNIAKVISDKLLAIHSEADYLKINRLQLIKRKRNLVENELLELENMERNTDDRKIICAVNILLDNKRKAKNELDKMTKEDKEIFMSYPIYNLL